MEAKLTQEQIQELRKEYLETSCTKTYLARKYNVSLTNICRKVKDLPTNRPTVNNQQVQQIIQLRKEGKSLRQIAEIVNLHFTTVRKYLKKNNIA